MMLIRVSLRIATAAMLLFSFIPKPTTLPPPEYDLLIKNGTVIDGSAVELRYRADVAIKGDRIVRIGKFAKARAPRE